ncbi:hypothetical protein [Spiroplasma cantharicola]|nr:hypothetical protein [Spiroplasma cantharicola]
MLKHILTVCAITNFSTASVTSITNFQNTTMLDKEQLTDFLRRDIEENKVYIGNQIYSEYDNKIFTSQESLNEYILSNSIVESEFTSSNPSKIIKDYEHMTLDENKIYDIDMDKFSPIYRDAFGNIAYTSDEALETYTHGGLVRQKYSYDEENWFDSPEEAKINQKNNMKINKSLYYQYNNKYYNAFNIKDINNLLSNFEEGYFVNKSKSLEGNHLLQPINEYGDKEILYKKMKRELKENFLDSYYYKVSKMDYVNSLQFGIKNKSELRIAFKGESQSIYYRGQYPSIIFANKYESKTEMVNDFKDKSKWSTGHEGSWTLGRNYWYRDFELKKPNDNKVYKATVKLVPKFSHGLGKNNPSFDDYNYEDKTVSKISTYYDSSQRQLVESIGNLNQRYSIQESTREDKAFMYDAWFEEYFQKNITNFKGNENKGVDYSDILNEYYIKNVDGSVYKDLMYDINYAKGTSFSLIQSYYDWLIVKNELLKKPIIIDGEKKYQLKPDFYATREQLDNFLQLQGKFNTVLKYSYGATPDLSSPDGKLLADSYEEAREKQFVQSSLSLKKRYIAYDVFGKSIESGNSEQEAIRALKRNIALQSKMTHKKEIDSWNNNIKKSYDSIISDGRYLVYKLKDLKTNSYIYYSSQEMALKAALSNARINGDVNKMAIEKYMYTYSNSLIGEEISVIFYNNDIQSAIDKILLKTNSKKRILN